VGLGRRREGNRKDRHRPRLDKSKTRLESPWPCRMMSVGGLGVVFELKLECQNRGKYHGIE